MGHTTCTDADRDEGGRLKAPSFSALVADTMTAVGAKGETKAEETPRSAIGRLEIAGIAVGLVVALALIVLIGRVAPAQEAPKPTARPAVPTAVAPAIIPALTPLPTEAPSVTPEPAPTPEPEIVYVEVEKPCYSVTMDVYDGSRPLGTVTGQSCESQDAAQAAADQLAAEMRGK